MPVPANGDLLSAGQGTPQGPWTDQCLWAAKTLLRRQGSPRRSPAVVMVSSGQMTRIGHGRCHDSGAQRAVSGVIAVSAPTAGACGLSRYLRCAGSFDVSAEDVAAILAEQSRPGDPCVLQLPGPGPFSPPPAAGLRTLAGTAQRNRASDTHLARGAGGRPLPRTRLGPLHLPPRAAPAPSRHRPNDEVTAIGA